MAKSARSSSKKANNQRKVRNINGPVEAARAQRLSARLIELAKQPKPETSDVKMDGELKIFHHIWQFTASDFMQQSKKMPPTKKPKSLRERQVSRLSLFILFYFIPDRTNHPCPPLEMEVDSVKPSSGRIEKKKSVDKRRQKKSSIVFQKYSDRQSRKKKSSA